MTYKVCTKCNNTLAATTEYFHVLKNGMYGLRSVCKKCMADEYKKKYIPIPKKTEKQCGRCKEVFPLTGEYFFTKTAKKGTIIKGFTLKEDCTSFRSVCKQCNTAQGSERKRAKLMIKYNASSQEELDKIIYAMRTRAGLLGAYANLNVPSKRRKYNYPENASINEMCRLRKIYDKGFDPATYQEEWKKRWLEKTKATRKYNYPEEYKDVERLPRSVVHKMQSEHMNDGIIANRLGLRLEDIPQELLELKRKQLKFYRYVKEKKANR